MVIGRNMIMVLGALILCSITALSQSLGAVVGAVLAFLAAAWFPILLIPLLMFAGAYQLLTVVGPLQFGWMIIVGAFGGLMIRMVMQSGSLRLDRYFVFVAILFLTIGLISSLLLHEGRLDRLATLVMLLILVSYLVAIDFSDPKLCGARSETNLIFAVALGAVITTLFLFVALQLGLADTRRASELAIGFGESGGGSSNISRILGYATVVLTIAALTLQKVKVSIRLLCFGVAIFAFIGMVYAGSRMPVLASLAGISLAILWSQHLSLGRIRLVSLVLSIVLISLVVVVISIFMRVETIVVPFLSDQAMSLRIVRGVSIESNIRVVMWQQHLETLTPFRAVFGSGVGSFGNPHSVFVGSLATFGIFGAVAVLFIMAYVVFAGGKKGLVISLPLVIYIVLAYASSSDVDRTQFWILIAISLVLVRARGDALQTDILKYRSSIDASVMTLVGNRQRS